MTFKSSASSTKIRCIGFTLIELLIVMAIIGILIGITFSGATYIYSAQQEKKALADMEALKLALEEFKSEHGDYPRTNDLEGDAEKKLPLLTGARLFLALSSYVTSMENLMGIKRIGPRLSLKVMSFPSEKKMVIMTR